MMIGFISASFYVRYNSFAAVFSLSWLSLHSSKRRRTAARLAVELLNDGTKMSRYTRGRRGEERSEWTDREWEGCERAKGTERWETSMNRDPLSSGRKSRSLRSRTYTWLRTFIRLSDGSSTKTLSSFLLTCSHTAWLPIEKRRRSFLFYNKTSLKSKVAQRTSTLSGACLSNII